MWSRLFSEARAVARIQHRNVCPVFDVGQSHGRYYLAMALVQGESLATQLQRGCLDCRQAATLAWKLAGALAVVHAAGIIHRDVKPQNVMLDAEGEPLLTDFGLARPVRIRRAARGRCVPVRHAGLHVAGTGPRRAGHRCQRHLRLGIGPLPDVDRPAALRRTVAATGIENPLRQTHSAPRPPLQSRSCTGVDLPEGHRKATGGPFPIGQGVGERPFGLLAIDRADRPLFADSRPGRQCCLVLGPAALFRGTPAGACGRADYCRGHGPHRAGADPLPGRSVPCRATEPWFWRFLRRMRPY